MFTIKIYANGSIFIRPCESVHILTSEGETYQEECTKLKDDYLASGICDTFRPSGSELSDEDQLQHYMQSMMPFAFIFYDQGAASNTWFMHGSDQAYVVNEQGQTIETVRQPKTLTAEIEE